MAILILLALLVAGAAGAQERNWVVTNGNWGTAANWSPPDVPNSATESALIPDGGGAYTITLDLNFGVDQIRALNPSATINLGGRQIHVEGAGGLINHGVLRTNATSQLWGHIDNRPSGSAVIQSGCTLYLHGPTCVNDGVILVNEQGTGDASLDITRAVDLSGSGVVILNGDSENDLISAYYGEALTQRAGHTIRGFGRISAPLVNYGTVDADRPGGFIRLSGSAKTNNGLLRASNGGLLHTSAVTIENAGGMILADGGDVLFQDGYINGGTLDRTGSSVLRSRNTRFTDVNIAPTGWIDLPSAYGVYLLGSYLANDGTIRLNDTGTGNSWIDVRSHVSLTGGGEILMNGDDASDDISAFYGHTLTQEAGHTIRGSGSITAPFVNRGTVDADRPGGFLQLSGNKTNNGLFRASNGGELRLRGTGTIYNTGGTILADGGNVLIHNQSHVAGGTLDRTGSSVFRIQHGWFQDATLADNCWVDIVTGYILYLEGTQVVNRGTIRLNDSGTGDAWIDVRSHLSLAGDGEILMNGDDLSDNISAYYGHTLTQEADHTIRGCGGITAPFVNHGTVNADRPGGYIRIAGVPKSNDGRFQATGGGELQINGCTIQNAGGTVSADGGLVRLANQAQIVGGTVSRSGASVIRAEHGWLVGSTIADDGWVDVASGYNLYLSGSQVTNHGTIRLNDTGTGDAWIDVRSPGLSLAGGGEILMNGNDLGDYIGSYYGHGFIQEADHTIHGKGRIIIPFTNRGTVRADSASYPLRVDTGSFDNQGVCEASGGAQLQIHRTPLNYASRRLAGGTWIARTNSSLVLNGAAVDTANAAILLDGPNANFYRDYSANNAFAGLVRIGPSGDFAIQNGRNFSTAGNLRVEGQLTIGEGCVFTVNGRLTEFGGGEEPSPGTATCVNGTLVATTGPVDIQGGRLCGRGTIQQSVTNSGRVSPGAALGELTINGSFTQTADGTCWIDLGGLGAGQHDHLQIGGHAALAGRLVVQSIEGYVPQVGDRFTILSFASRTGEFTLETGAPGVGLLYETYYYPDHIEIEVYGDPSYVTDPCRPEDSPAPLPAALRLFSRPRAGGAQLALDLPQPGRVRLEIFDFGGRCVAVLAAGAENAGRLEYDWNGLAQDGTRAAGGIYFARARVAEAGEATVGGAPGIARTLTARVLLMR